MDKATKNTILQDALQDCMKEDRKRKILIFCNTKRMADFLGIWIQEWLPKIGKFLVFQFSLQNFHNNFPNVYKNVQIRPATTSA